MIQIPEQAVERLSRERTARLERERVKRELQEIDQSRLGMLEQERKRELLVRLGGSAAGKAHAPRGGWQRRKL